MISKNLITNNNKNFVKDEVVSKKLKKIENRIINNSFNLLNDLVEYDNLSKETNASRMGLIYSILYFYCSKYKVKEYLKNLKNNNSIHIAKTFSNEIEFIECDNNIPSLKDLQYETRNFKEKDIKSIYEKQLFLTSNNLFRSLVYKSIRDTAIYLNFKSKLESIYSQNEEKKLFNSKNKITHMDSFILDDSSQDIKTLLNKNIEYMHKIYNNLVPEKDNFIGFNTSHKNKDFAKLTDKKLFKDNAFKPSEVTFEERDLFDEEDYTNPLNYIANKESERAHNKNMRKKIKHHENKNKITFEAKKVHINEHGEISDDNEKSDDSL